MSDRIVDVALSMLVLAGVLLWARSARRLWRGESKWNLPVARQRRLAIWLSFLVGFAYAVLLWNLWVPGT